MRASGSTVSESLSFLGFLTLFAGALLFGLGLQSAMAQCGPPPQPICFTCACLYPNSGWCAADPDPCSFNFSGCGCNAFTGCDDNTAPVDPNPYYCGCG